MDFENIAPYLQDPLVLIGFVLLLFFGFGRAILKTGIIPILDNVSGYKVIMRLLLFGFILAFAVILVGFGLKYKDLSEQEQRAAVNLLVQELKGNLAVANELKKNLETISSNTKIVADVLRNPDILLLSTMFPKHNIDANIEVPASLDLARQQLIQAKRAGLFENNLELRKFNLAGEAVSNTIGRTIGVIESLGDLRENRYVINSQVWETHLPILRKINIINILELQELYQDLSLLRNNYNVTVGYCVSYLREIRTFFSTTEEPINAQKLASILAAERIFITTLDDYLNDSNQKIKKIENIRNKLITY